MRSIEALTTKVIADVGQGGSMCSAVTLAPRMAPLGTAEIEKLGQTIALFADETRTPRYGYIPVKDASGDIIRSEYDVTGHDLSFSLKQPMPQKLIDAIARPAPREHIVYHLGRLATHRRDTRGAPAFAVVLEDIAIDLHGVAEWAVILGCREMRQKETAWYPTTGEIERIIRGYQDLVDRLVNLKPVGPCLAAPGPVDDDMASRNYSDLPRAKWQRQHFQWWLIDARNVRASFEARGIAAKVADWDDQIRQCEAALAQLEAA